MPFIADASVSLCWFLPDQFTEESTRILIAAQSEGIVVPVHWYLEVFNALGLKHRSLKLSTAQLKDALDVLERLPIEAKALDLNPTPLLRLMERHKLTAYDATYLHLALTSDLPLATYDKELIAAAPAEGVLLVS